MAFLKILEYFNEKLNKGCIFYVLIQIFLLTFLCQKTSAQEKINNNVSPITETNDLYIYQLDSLFIKGDFEALIASLNKLSTQCPTCSIDYISIISDRFDTIYHYTIDEIDSNSFIVSIENIRFLDELNYYLSVEDTKLVSKQNEILSLKCKFNNFLQKKLASDILLAYKLYKSNTNVSKAGDLIVNYSFLRSKFFRDTCFDKQILEADYLKMLDVLTWAEKYVLDLKYQKIEDNKPEWVKMGMSFTEYQEWWAQRLTVGSEYMGGGCNSCGKVMHRGKRGGTYYLNSKGNKQYVPR
ncbi:MAG: hypothetical protein EBS07_12380 [Sphingobacteriia bacterium]|nr:hypothetical protein [Sphingobacteriia bacterium]